MFQIENPWFPKEFRRDISSTFCYTGSGDEFSVSELCGPVNPFSDIFCFNFKQVLKFLFSSYGLYYFETGDYVDKIQVLAIVPYEGMKFSLSEVASQRQDMEIEIHIGDLEKGLDIVNALPLDSYDVILSRGGTAQMLRDATELPVVEISLSVYDILRSLRLAQNYTLRHAIVGFPSITDVSCLLRDLIQREINIFPIHNSEEATQVLQTLKADGYQMVIGDMITSTLAKQAGLNSVLITSGTESIENALNTVAEQYHSVRRQRRLNKLLLETLRSQNVQAFILDAQGQAVINTLSDQAQELKNSLKKEVDSLSKRGHYTYTKKSRDKTRQYIVEAQQLEADHLLYNAFFLTPDLSADFIGIEYIDAQKAEKRYLDSFFISGLQDREISEKTKRYLKSSLPCWLEGEPGTGKDCMAYNLYLQSACQNTPLILIDCAVLDSKGWKHLLTNARSPLQGSGQMIYLRSCESIPEIFVAPLFEWMESIGLRQNKLVLGFSDLQTPTPHSVYSRMENAFSGLRFFLPPLRDSMNEIHNLISLCISTLNMSLGKEIIGMDDEAIEQIQNFPWPENYSQLRRVLSQAMLLTEGGLIQGSTIRKLLRSEFSYSAAGEKETALLPDMTLHEYQRCIIQQVLKAENNNQSQAAKRLGISRSTLWRMLKEI